MKLDSPIFQNVDAARDHLEAQRWPNGAVCPHCGNCDQTRILAMVGKAHRPGLYNCKECRNQFSVTIGTVFERSKIPLNKWLLATFLLSSSKKGMSSHQLHRMLGVTYKTAWFMAHRIREAMKENVQTSSPLGGAGKIVEADETYHGKRETPRNLSRGRIAKPTKAAVNKNPATAKRKPRQVNSPSSRNLPAVPMAAHAMTFIVALTCQSPSHIISYPFHYGDAVCA